MMAIELELVDKRFYEHAVKVVYEYDQGQSFNEWTAQARMSSDVSNNPYEVWARGATIEQAVEKCAMRLRNAYYEQGLYKTER